MRVNSGPDERHDIDAIAADGLRHVGDHRRGGDDAKAAGTVGRGRRLAAGGEERNGHSGDRPVSRHGV
jgi:hypothetical protein